jgi:hypothetical protein
MDLTELSDADLASLSDEVQAEVDHRAALLSIDILATLRQAAADLSSVLQTVEYAAVHRETAEALADRIGNALRSDVPPEALLVVHPAADWRALLAKLRLITAGVPS